MHLNDPHKETDFLTQLTDELVKEEQAVAHAISDFSHQRIKDVMDELHADLPILEHAGFKLHRLEVELGVTPKIIPHFRVIEHPSPEQQRKILDEAKQKRLLHLMLSSLFKVSYLQRMLKIGDLEFHALKIEVCAVPKVHLIFQ